MIAVTALALPLVSAGLNRKWRGEGQVPRWVWYGFMTLAGYALTLDPVFEAAWFAFLAGYAALPWHAMFSAIHGRPPGRTDGIFQFMQEIAHALTRASLGQSDSPPFSHGYWLRFGIIYGAVRVLPTVPAVFFLAAYTQSPAPFVGLLMLGMGYVYYLAGKLSAYYDAGESLAVMMAEVFMGWAIMTFALVCAGQL